MDPQTGRTDAQHRIVGTVITTCVLTNVIVLMRLTVRKFIVKDLGWDDLAIFLALLICNVGTALVLVQVHYGFGRHHSEIAKADYVQYLRYSYYEWIQTFQTLMLTKISICLLLLRIIINRSFRNILYLWVALLLISNFAITGIWIAQCRPVSLAWNDPAKPLKCMTQSELLHIILAQAVVSIVSDFILAAYPVYIIHRLKMKRSRKIALSILMGLGVFTGSLSIARTVLNWQNINEDASWAVLPNWYLRSMEVLMGFIAACLPTLNAGIGWLRGRVPGSSQESSRKTPSGEDAVPDHADAYHRYVRNESSKSPLAKGTGMEKHRYPSTSDEETTTASSGYSPPVRDDRLDNDYIASKGTWLDDTVIRGASPIGDLEMQRAATPAMLQIPRGAHTRALSPIQTQLDSRALG